MVSCYLLVSFFFRNGVFFSYVKFFGAGLGGLQDLGAPVH